MRTTLGRLPAIAPIQSAWTYPVEDCESRAKKVLVQGSMTGSYSHVRLEALFIGIDMSMDESMVVISIASAKSAGCLARTTGSLEARATGLGDAASSLSVGVSDAEVVLFCATCLRCARMLCSCRNMSLAQAGSSVMS